MKYPAYVKGRIAQTGPPQGGIQIGRQTGDASPAPPVSRAIPRYRSFVPASPGVDGAHNHGTLTSGAGNLETRGMTNGSQPWEWGSINPAWNRANGEGVGGGRSIFPVAKDPSQIRNRKRGVSPWGGFFKASNGVAVHESGMGAKTDVVVKPGGTTDMNPGSDNAIAGGRLGAMQASTMCRLNGSRQDRNMRLPVMPTAATRSGVRMNPSGGAPDGGPAAPLVPVAPGVPSIFGFFATKTPQPLTAPPRSIKSQCGG